MATRVSGMCVSGNVYLACEQTLQASRCLVLISQKLNATAVERCIYGLKKIDGFLGKSFSLDICVI